MVQQGLFQPSFFKHQQMKSVKDFFNQNNYINFKYMRKNMKINDPRKFLEKNFGGKVVLFNSVCFHQDNIEYYKVQLEELLKGDGYVDVAQVIPVVEQYLES